MSQSAFQRFVAELRRRRVPQTAAIYLVAAWAAIEFSDVVVPNLNGPQWIVTAVIVAAGVGFPVVLVLAWMFDWGPEGVERTADEADLDGPQTGTPTGGAGPTPWLAVIAVLVVGIGSAVGVAALLMNGTEPGGSGEPAAGRAEQIEPRGQAEADASEPPPRPAMGSLDSVRRVLESLEGGGLEELARLEGLEALGEWGDLGRRVDSMDDEQLEAVAQQVADELDQAVLIRRPRNWRLGQGVPVRLALGDTLEVDGIAQDSTGVVAVLVDGQTVAQRDPPVQTLPFSARLVGTPGRGLRTVPIVVRTGDGREVRAEYFLVYPPDQP